MTVIFKAKTTEGYIIKIMSELLHNNIRLACLKIQPEGIFIRMMDSNRLVLMDIAMQCDHFNVYELGVPELNIGINIGHLFKMLKSIKKKDAVMFSVDNADTESLIITVFPKESKRVISATIRIQPVQHISIPLPDGYRDPVNIGSNDFQQTIKDIASISDSVLVSMKRYSMYLASNTEDSIYTKKVDFGEEDDATPIYYSDTFNMEQFTRILKIAGLCDTLQVFGGGTDKPLLIQSPIGNLGMISVFIKSQRQIKLDETD
jgi:proliferating cell nuclear antigen